jgi:small subunit ribosomal protein S16
VVVADANAPRDGRYVDHLGFYDPLTDPATIQIDTEKAQAWIQKGAKPSERVAKLLSRSSGD